MLARIRKAMDENEEGFTLIELLVVMIIIGILAAIAIPVFLSQKTKAYEAGLKSDLTNVATNLATATVDDPATIAVTSAGNLVTIKGSDATPTVIGTYTVNLSSGNIMGNVVAWATADGSYCVSVIHGTAAGVGVPQWYVGIPTGGGSQVLAKGACPATGF